MKLKIRHTEQTAPLPKEKNVLLKLRQVCCEVFILTSAPVMKS